MRMLAEDKIKTREELVKIVNKLRRQGKKIVTTNGVFDILHIGHLAFLEEAKQQGDVLIVCVNSDKSVKKLKGVKRPINDEMKRAQMVAGLGCVDYVTIFDEKDPRELIKAIKPDIHANGQEYGYECIEAEVVREVGGRIYLIKKIEDESTTNIIEKILRRFKTRD